MDVCFWRFSSIISSSVVFNAPSEACRKHTADYLCFYLTDFLFWVFLRRIFVPWTFCVGITQVDHKDGCKVSSCIQSYRCDVIGQTMDKSIWLAFSCLSAKCSSSFHMLLLIEHVQVHLLVLTQSHQSRSPLVQNHLYLHDLWPLTLRNTPT